MDKKTILPWGQPWNFIFTKRLDEPERKEAMANLGSKLYKYIENSLGSKNYFTLQLKWSRSFENEQIYRLDADLIVSHEGVVAWWKKHKLVSSAIEGDSGSGIAAMAGTKPPPPPPPPPPRAVELLGDAPPFRYFSNRFIQSHVLNFSQNGVITQFNEHVFEALEK
jgi:hypothetical protein